MTYDDYLRIYGMQPCLVGMDRPEITKTLSIELECLILARRNAHACWAREVKLWPDDKRVDYIDFCPHPTISCRSVGSVERGKFTFYEVKSCMADYKSGNGTNFDGDENWMVCPVELFEEMRQKQEDVSVGVLAYGLKKNGTRGFVKINEGHKDRWGRAARKYSCAELLYAMTRAGIRQGIRNWHMAQRVRVGNGEYGHHECSKCGSTVSQRDNFCWSCGARLEDQ